MPKNRTRSARSAANPPSPPRNTFLTGSGVAPLYVIEQRILALLICGASPEFLASSVELREVGPGVCAVVVSPGHSLIALGSHEKMHEMVRAALTPVPERAQRVEEATWLVEESKDGRPKVGKVDMDALLSGLDDLAKKFPFVVTASPSENSGTEA